MIPPAMTEFLAGLDITPFQLALAGFGFLFAAFVKGATGIGFATTCVPILVLAVGIERALPLVLIPSLTSNFILMAQAGGFVPSVKRFWPMFIITPLGILAGLYVLATTDRAVPTAILGVVLIVYGLYAQGRADRELSPSLARVLALPTGFSTGLVNGITGSQIMPIMPYLLSLKLSPPQFIQTMNISFTLSSLLMAVGLQRIGFLTTDLAVLSVAAILPVFLGTWVGVKLRKRMNADQFRATVLWLLVALGVILIGRSVVF